MMSRHTYEIRGSYGGIKITGLLGHDAIWPEREVPTFRRNLSLPVFFFLNMYE
jgi:hypothetical protein